MAIKYSKTPLSEKQRAASRLWHKEMRTKRHNDLIQKLGGECMQCGSKENLWMWYTWRPEEHGIHPHKAWQRSQKAADGLKLGRYHLLCKTHFWERRREELPKRQHGTAATYCGSGRTPCRCALCTAAWNEYTKKWHKQNKIKRRAARQLLKSGALAKMFK